MTNRSNKESCWLKWYYIATYVLAIIAILSLYLSIKSSMQTSEILNNVISDFTEPVITVESYDWINDKNVDCVNPPAGILVNYINRSNIPLVFKNIDFSISYDNNKFENTAINVGPLNKSYIVAPGKKLTESQVNKPIFQRYLANKKGAMTAPYLQCQLIADIQNISGSKKYKLKYVHQLGVDCSFPNARVIVPLKEELTPISTPLK